MSTPIMPKPAAKRLGYIVKRTQQSLRTRMEQELRIYELTTPQYGVLSAVARTPKISNSDLAKASFVTPQTMQGIVATLEKRGLLERSSDPDHGRRLMAQLTSSGQKALKAADNGVIKIEAIMVGQIPSDEVEHAVKTLLACIENLAEK